MPIIQDIYPNFCLELGKQNTLKTLFFKREG